MPSLKRVQWSHPDYYRCRLQSLQSLHQNLLPQGAPHPRTCSHQHHSGWLCRIASSSARDAERNEVWKHTKLRSSKYLNNLVEQDHRGINSRTGPMLGFKRFDYAAITIAGVELLHRIHKGQFALGHLRLKDQAAPAIWNAVLVDQSFSRTLLCPTKIFAPEPSKRFRIRSGYSEHRPTACLLAPRPRHTVAFSKSYMMATTEPQREPFENPSSMYATRFCRILKATQKN
jgi:hypothetical protein